MADDFVQGKILEVLKSIDAKLTMALRDLHSAEQEIPEYMRRFVTYYHDLMHIKWGYEEAGVPPPDHIMQESERAHDRMRLLVDRESSQGGKFHKIRQELHEEGGNRYNHDSRRLR